MTRRTVIMGAAGRDFHDFNVCFRGNPDREVVAFTRVGSQNVGELDEEPGRVYPPSLAGEGYPDGIPIHPESELESVIRSEDVDEVVFSYSDVSHEYVMQQASRALARGANFRILGTEMMLEASVPVVAVDAVRTGCGKSGVSRRLADLLSEYVSVAVVREPMPYGELTTPVRRFDSMAALEEANVTIEEREEYEHHLASGHAVYSGIDYEAVLERAESDADLVLWDGGNNELHFFVPDLHVVLGDPLRAGDEIRYHPGETNLQLADYVLINKENSAADSAIWEVLSNVRDRNPEAAVIHANSVISVEEPERIAGKRVLVVEDGPTVTHGGASEGAAAIAARTYDAGERVDPRSVAVGSIRAVFESYPHLGSVLPAMGYSETQLADLEATIAAAAVDLVLSGTPIDLGRVVDVEVPILDVTYEVEEIGEPTLRSMIEAHASELALE